MQKEYQDVLIRTFKLSGIISFENALVNLSNQELASFVFKDLEIVGNLNDDDFIQNLSIAEILGFNSKEVSNLKNRLIAKYNIPTGTPISTFFKTLFDDEFENKIAQRYSDNGLCEILQMFSNKQQPNAIQEKVTQDANIPTIFEYLVAIAWHRIAKGNFRLKDSMNLSLDETAIRYPMHQVELAI